MKERVQDLVEVCVGACGLVLVQESRFPALKTKKPALLEPLLLLGREPGLPALENVLEVAHAVPKDSISHGKGGRDVEEGAPHAGVELERVVANVFRIREKVLFRETRFLREIPPSLGRSDRDQKKLDILVVQLRLDVSSELNSKLPAQGSPETSPESDQHSLVRLPHVRQSHPLAVGHPVDFAPLERQKLFRLFHDDFVSRRRRARLGSGN